VRILIVEDNLLIAEMLKEMLHDLGHTVVCICTSFEDVFNKLQTGVSVDIVFLDINLEKNKSGIDIGLKLTNELKLPFIYLTSYSDPKTIKSASKTLPETYLTKPFNQIQLFSALEIFKEKLGSIVKSIVIKDGIKKIKLNRSDIYYIKTEGNYIEVVTENKRFIVRNSLENFIQNLNDKYFTRVHRSYAVNIKLVEKIKNKLIYINESEIPLSRKYRENILDLYKNLD